MSGRRLVVGGLLSVSLLGAGAAAGSVGAATAGIVTYPDSQTIPRSGRLPSGGGHALSLNEPVGGAGAGLVVVSGAGSTGAVVDARTLAPIQVQLRFWHYVRFGSSLYPDALVPWTGGAARLHGKKIFAYTYYGVRGFPSFRATEPLSNPRVFVLWAALEGLDGILYGQGMTSYKTGVDPLSTVDDGGESILIYPGGTSPAPSARVEQIRDGIEDAEIFAVVRRRFGPAKVRQILGSHGLFSADASGVELACVVGCDLKGTPPQAWPRWSHDLTTAGHIEAARLDALRVASG